MKPLDALEGLVSSKLEIFNSVLSLMKLEARLAGLSVLPLLLNLVLLIVALATVWLSAMLLLGYGLASMLNSIAAISFILVLNMVLLGLLIHYLTFNLNSMSFKKTRTYLFHEADHELKEASVVGYSRNRKKITAAPASRK